MLADERTRTVVHREWTLRAPAHWTDVNAAAKCATQKHAQESGRATDIEFACEDDLLVIGYTVEGGPELKDAARAEWERRALAAEAKVARAADLADFWKEPPKAVFHNEDAANELLAALAGTEGAAR